jgi:hypothetical protein
MPSSGSGAGRALGAKQGQLEYYMGDTGDAKRKRKQPKKRKKESSGKKEIKW